MTGSLTSKTVNGLKWSYTSTITTSVLQIGYTAIMARLLDPKSFGLIAMASVLLRFGSYFAQMGMGQAIVQKKEINEEDIRSSFTSSLVLSTFFLLLTWFSAPLAPIVFNNTEVISIIRVLAVSFIFTGLSTTSIALLRRNLKFKSLAVIEITSYILGYAGVGILSAYSGLGVWSLVYASLSQGCIVAILSFITVKHSIIPLFNWEKYKPLLSFGSRVSIVSFLEFIGATLDSLLIGRFLGAGKLGIYNRASMIVNLPMEYFTSSISKVLFPSLSRIQGDKEKLKNIYLNSISAASYFLFPACFGIFIVSEQIVLVILGDKWSDAIPVLKILALVAPLNLIAHFGGIVLEATANLNQKIILQVIFILVLGSLFYFFREWGLIGFAVSLLFAHLLRNIGYLIITKNILGFKVKEIFNSYYPSFVSGLFIAVLLFLSLFFLRKIFESDLILLFILTLLGTVTLLSLLFTRLNICLRNFLEERVLGNLKIYKNLKRIFSLATKYSGI